MKKLKALLVSVMCLTMLGAYVTNYSARESLTRRYSGMYTRTLGTSYLKYYGKAIFKDSTNKYDSGAAIVKAGGDATLAGNGYYLDGSTVVVKGLASAPNNYGVPVIAEVKPSSSPTAPR